MSSIGPYRNPIKELMKACTAKLTDPAGALLGTGFFVTPHKLATCRHVFFKGDRLDVPVFCIAGREARFEVRSNFQDYPVLDLVVIDLMQDISERCVDLKAETNWQSQSLWAWTYNNNYPDGTGVATALKETARHNGMDVVRISRDALFIGSSGTPVLSEGNHFIGIVYWVKERDGDALLIPAVYWKDYFGPLYEENQAHHQSDAYWADAQRKSTAGHSEYPAIHEKVEERKAYVNTGGMLMIDRIGLSPVKLFLNKVLPDLLPEHIPIFDEYNVVINNFFQSSHKQILLISGPNESGKTHLLRKLVIESLELSWNVFQIEHRSSGFVLPEQLTDSPILLLRDDIDWDSKELLDTILQFVNSHRNVKLILTFHQLWKGNIDTAIEKVKGLPGRIESITLPQWKSEQLVEVLRLSAKMPSLPNEWDIVGQFPNPYLLKLFGETIVGNPSMPIEDVGQNFAQKIERTFRKCLPSGWSDSKVDSFILYLHFNRIRESDLQEFAVNFDLPEIALNEILENLKRAGSLRCPNGGYWHITPGVKGDFYLAKKLSGTDAAGVRSLIPVLLEVNPEVLAAKLVAAMQFMHTQKKTGTIDFLQDLFKNWTKNIGNDPGLLTPQCLSAAKEALSLELSDLMLNRHDSISATQNVTNAACSFVTGVLLHQIESDDTACFSFDIFTPFVSKTPYGSIYAGFLEELVKLPRKRNDCLSLLQEIWIGGWDSKENNFPPEAILANAFKPLNEYNDATSIEVGLKYARHWLLESREPALHKMAVKALQTMLGVYFDHISSESITTYFHVIPLPDDERIYQFREKAIGLALEALEQEGLQLEALNILDHIGKTRNPRHPLDNQLKQFPRIQREIELCIPLVGKILQDSKDFLVQKRAELILFDWWLWNASVSIEDWLLNFERTPEYDLYSYSLFGRIEEDFATLKSEAPEENRYDWYWKQLDMQERRRMERNEKYESLAQQLADKYEPAEQIAQFIHESMDKLIKWEKLEGRSSSVVAFTNIIQVWVNVVPKSFKTLIATTELSKKLPEWMRTQIEQKLIEQGQTELDEIALPLLARIPDLTRLECHQLVVLIQQYNPLQKEEWLIQMIDQGSEELLTQIADRLNLLFPPEQETAKIASYLLRICSSGKITRETFFSGWSQDARESFRELSRHLDQVPSEIDEKLRRTTFDLIKKMSRIDFSSQDVLNYCVRNVEHLIELFDYRAANFSFKNYNENSDFVVREVLVESGFAPNELPGLFKTPENHRSFIDRLQDWELKAQIMSSDWKHRYLNVADPESKELWLLKHLKNALAENNVEAVERYCAYIPREDQYLPLILQAWTKLVEHKSATEMKAILWYWIVTKEFTPGWQRPEYNYYDRPMEILEWLSQQPNSGLRLKHLLDQIKNDLEKEQQKMRGDE